MATFGAAISEHPDAAQAVGEVVGAVVEAVGVAPDLAVLFISGHPVEAVEEIATAVRSLLSPGVLIGSTTVAAIGRETEAEDGPAVSLWVGRVGPVEPVRFEVVRSSEGTAVVGMPDAAASERRTLILLADPMSFPADSFARAGNHQYPALTIVGGVVSAPGGVGASRLVLDGAIHSDGAIGALLPPGLGEFAVVSQGCRPIGAPLIVTEAEANVVRGLGSRPALDRLQELFDGAGDHDRELLGQGLHVGLAVDERTEAFARGDFLVRGVLGATPDEGSIRVGDRVEVGTTLQFQVRDAATAREDLAELLSTVDADAALVFTCNGRGRRLFGEADHDARAVVDAVGGGPVAGMFCAGEIGPVGGQNHVHGFSASVLFLYG